MTHTYHWYKPNPGNTPGPADPQVVRVDGDLVWFFGTTNTVDRKDLKGWLGPPLPKPA